MKSVYRVGGADFDGSEANCLRHASDARRYDIDEQKWERLCPLPVPRYMHAAAWVGGSLVVMGGIDAAAASPPHAAVVPSSDVFRCCDGRWRRVASMAQRRCFIGAAVVAGNVYVFGGQGENNYVHNSAEVYDPRCDTWDFIRPMPLPRLGYGIASVGHRIFLAGGMTGSLHLLNRLDIYDASTNCWSLGPLLPFPRAFSSLIAMPPPADAASGAASALYLVGGIVCAPDMALNDVIPIPLTDVDRLKLNDKGEVNVASHWTSLGHTLCPRMSPHLIPSSSDAFIIIGGFNQEAAMEVRTPQVYSATPVGAGDANTNRSGAQDEDAGEFLNFAGAENEWFGSFMTDKTDCGNDSMIGATLTFEYG